MPQLIIAAILIYLYYLLIKWLFTSVGPGFVYFLSLAMSFAVPVAYVGALMKIFGHPPAELAKRWRNWGFIGVIALVGLVQIDMLYLVTGTVLGQLPVATAYEVHSWLAKLAEQAVINREARALGRAAWGLDGMALVLLSAAVKSALLVPTLLAIRGLASPVAGVTQPAQVSYFHGQALTDLGDVAQTLILDLVKLVLLANMAIVKATAGPQALFVWPLSVLAYVALVPPVIIAIGSAALLLALHAIALATVWVFAMFASIVLMAAERGVVLARTGYAKCPHAECHAAVPLPVFLCPHCGVEHDRLLPGRFGVLVRECQCRDGRLPTLFWFGKRQLRSLCAKCRKPLKGELFAESVHIPIYGGSSAGKTMFMMAAIWEMLEGKVASVDAHLIEETSDRAYRGHWKPDFESGRLREKTARTFPDAFLVSVRRKLGLPAAVYLYDPAGEALLREADLDAHHFIEHMDGLALLIDPLSLPSFAQRYREAGGPDQRASTSQADPEVVLAEVVNLLERRGKLSRKKGSRQRVAVILTKADLPGLAAELGIRLESSVQLALQWGDVGLDESARIRAWLANSEPHLLRVLETRFADLRFFAVSALGHSPQPGRPFVPRGVAEPMAWLLSTRRALRRPLWARISGRAAEVAAVAAVLVALVVGPLVGLLVWLRS